MKKFLILAALCILPSVMHAKTHVSFSFLFNSLLTPPCPPPHVYMAPPPPPVPVVPYCYETRVITREYWTPHGIYQTQRVIPHSYYYPPCY